MEACLIQGHPILPLGVGGALQALVSFTSVLNRFEPQFPRLQNMVSETHLRCPLGS